MLRIMFLLLISLLFVSCSTVESNTANATQTTLDTAVSHSTQGIINDINN